MDRVALGGLSGGDDRVSIQIRASTSPWQLDLLIRNFEVQALSIVGWANGDGLDAQLG